MRDSHAQAANGAARLQAAFAREEYLGLRLGARVRAIALAVIAVSIALENPFPQLLYYYVFIALFAALGVVPLWLHHAGRSRRWMRYLFPLLDVALLTLAVFLPNPLDTNPLPTQMLLRFGNELYLFVFICAAVFTYSPAVVLWTGMCAAALWSLATLYMLRLPDTVRIGSTSAWNAMSDAEKFRVTMDPHRVNLGLWTRQVALFVVTALILAAFVRRVRRLVAQQAEAERERANLSRYFSPNLVDELARADQPLGPTRQQDVAVLFADVVGFTSLAETLAPAAAIELLRAYHGRMVRVVFEHGGTVDKYIGDGLMATFGTPRVGPTDATNALRCTRAMVAAMDAWNDGRAGRGEPPIRIGIGLHYGSVVLGDIGGESRLEYTAIGDAVNVASRLERLTREQAATIVASDALVEAARREQTAGLADPLSGFIPGPPQALRGRATPIAIWQWRR